MIDAERECSNTIHWGAIITGAGTGAVVGAQVASAAGPGVAIGAGFGAAAGAIQGIIEDKNEENLLVLSAQTQRERSRAYVHELLAEHYKRRMELHPSRDLYPADIFFDSDKIHLNSVGSSLVQEIAALSKHRLPSSRLVVACYVRANDAKGDYAERLAEERAKSVVNGMVRAGIEPRRLTARGVVVDAPVLLDPLDKPERYNQAIEIIAMDN